MTAPYPATSNPSEVERRFHEARVVPYTDANPGDLVGSLIGSIGAAKYDGRGQFVITVEVPFDIIGDPTELMRSQGRMLLWEIRKI